MNFYCLRTCRREDATNKVKYLNTIFEVKNFKMIKLLNGVPCQRLIDSQSQLIGSLKI